jgi:Flp pilus assembly protein TadG
MLQSRTGLRKGGWRAQKGVAALEFGLAVPLLAVLITAIVEIGYSMYQAMQVAYVAESGLGYAQKYGWKSSDIARSAANSTSLSGVTVTPTQYCACPSASGLATAACGSSCSSGSAAGQYIKVSVSVQRKSIIGTTGFGLPSTLSAQAILRQN